VRGDLAVVVAADDDQSLAPAPEHAEQQQQAEQDRAGAGQSCDLRDRPLGLQLGQQPSDIGAQVVGMHVAGQFRKAQRRFVALDAEDGDRQARDGQRRRKHQRDQARRDPRRDQHHQLHAVSAKTSSKKTDTAPSRPLMPATPAELCSCSRTLAPSC